MSVTVILPVQLHHVEEWCTFTPKKDLRAYPGTVRGTEEWNNTYKIRTTVERSINHLKDSFGGAGRKPKMRKHFSADLILAGITQLIGVLR